MPRQRGEGEGRVVAKTVVLRRQMRNASRAKNSDRRKINLVMSYLFLTTAPRKRRSVTMTMVRKHLKDRRRGGED
tara:strand:- start:1303 stop:1527 length:225 start_codon:yes stop_codon:yes gene_type:complete